MDPALIAALFSMLVESTFLSLDRNYTNKSRWVYSQGWELFILHSWGYTPLDRRSLGHVMGPHCWTKALFSKQTRLNVPWIKSFSLFLVGMHSAGVGVWSPCLWVLACSLGLRFYSPHPLEHMLSDRGFIHFSHGAVLCWVEGFFISMIMPMPRVADLFPHLAKFRSWIKIIFTLFRSMYSIR